MDSNQLVFVWKGEDKVKRIDPPHGLTPRPTENYIRPASRSRPPLRRWRADDVGAHVERRRRQLGRGRDADDLHAGPHPRRGGHELLAGHRLDGDDLAGGRQLDTGGTGIGRSTVGPRRRPAAASAPTSDDEKRELDREGLQKAFSEIDITYSS